MVTQSSSTLAQAMAWCRKATLIRCQLFICILHHSSEGNSILNADESNYYNTFEKHTFEIKATSFRGPWVYMIWYVEAGQELHQAHEANLCPLVKAIWDLFCWYSLSYTEAWLVIICIAFCQVWLFIHDRKSILIYLISGCRLVCST